MRKLFLLLFSATAMTSAVYAQSAVAPEIGLNLANMKFKAPGATANTTVKPGLLLGLNYQAQIADNIYLQPGIFYKMNGAKESDYGKEVVKINTIQVPVDVYYKFGAPGTNRFGIGVGLYAALNLSGKVVVSDYTDPNGTFTPGYTQTLKIGSTADQDDLKAFDFGGSVNASYDFANGFYIHARYEFGFANLDPAGQSDYSIRTSAYSIAVGYYLPQGKPRKQKMAPPTRKN